MGIEVTNEGDSMNVVKAICIAAALSVSTAAHAGLWCKNDVGQVLEWYTGQSWHPAPTGDFAHSSARDVICFVRGTTYKDIAGVGLPYVGGLPIQGGMIYRGEAARWLVDNLGALYGTPATFEYFSTANP